MTTTPRCVYQTKRKCGRVAEWSVAARAPHAVVHYGPLCEKHARSLFAEFDTAKWAAMLLRENDNPDLFATLNEGSTR